MVQRHLSEVCAGAAAVVVSDYEHGDVNALVERSQALLSSALDALDVVDVLWGGGRDVDFFGDGESSEEALSSPPPEAGQDDLADVVLLARMGIRQRLRSLRELSERARPWERLAAAGSALRTIQKSLSAVDRVMADAEQVPPSLRFYENAVELSLAVRRRYVQLHGLLVREAPPDPDLRSRLRLVGNAIAHLLGSSVAPHLRPRDRALLMMSHARVREQLSRRDDDATRAESARRLWEDLTSLATMFLDVNRREELLRHDAQLVREALRDLDGAPQDRDEHARLLARLAPMCGRCPALDALLEKPPEDVDRAALRRTLEELEQALGAAGGPVF